MRAVTDETEVARAERSWSPDYKLKILREIDQASERGRVGEICRREDLYPGLIDAWRRQRDAGALEGLRDRKTGPKPVEAPRAELARMRAEIEALEANMRSLSRPRVSHDNPYSEVAFKTGSNFLRMSCADTFGAGHDRR